VAIVGSNNRALTIPGATATPYSPWGWTITDGLQVAAETISAAWFFAIGACCGSFLNVVVYRLPRRESLLGRSRCPSCRQAIWARDNVPVWGWIHRGGRCRACWLPIASRYPRVELAVGVAFLVLAMCEVALWSMNLTGPTRHHRLGFAATLFEGQSLLLWRFTFHALLIMFLLAWALVIHDRQVVPWSLTVTGCLTIVIVTLVRPQIQSQFWHLDPRELAAMVVPGWTILRAVGRDLVWGVALSLGAGWLLARSAPGWTWPIGVRQVAPPILLLGLCLGGPLASTILIAAALWTASTSRHTVAEAADPAPWLENLAWSILGLTFLVLLLAGPVRQAAATGSW